MKVYQDTKMPFCKSQMVNFIKYTYCWFEWMQNLSVLVQMILSEIKMNREMMIFLTKSPNGLLNEK